MEKSKVRKAYHRPVVKVVEWDFNESICATPYVASPCINIDNGNETIRIDHRASYGRDHIEWTDWRSGGSVDNN